MPNQQAAATCSKETGVWRPLRVKRKFSSTRKSLEVVRNLLRAHRATA